MIYYQQTFDLRAYFMIAVYLGFYKNVLNKKRLQVDDVSGVLLPSVLLAVWTCSDFDLGLQCIRTSVLRLDLFFPGLQTECTVCCRSLLICAFFL